MGWVSPISGSFGKLLGIMLFPEQKL
jgi:hypothetical protein